MAILTIAREYGSGGKEIGRAVADVMNYRYVDRRQILDDMKAVGPQWEEFAKYFDENNPNIWERFKWSFRGYVALIQYHILRYAMEDNVVIVGRGGNFLLKGIPYALRIRTQAPIKNRIERVVEWGDTNIENARYLIEKADKEMAGAVYLIYGFAWNDRTQYDMIFDTSLQTYEEIVSIIKNELEKREQFKTEKAKKVLELKLIAAKIKAEVAINPRLFVSSLDVKFKEEGLVEYGLIVKAAVHNEEDIPQIKEIAERICGDIPVEFDLKFRWHSRLGPWRYK
ncbi:MAG: cytidylate kinase-like family protein [Syntrophorhabdaceae bacterium]|nr:cytidylate kinase-like family protein [Syntrophorhabdales bacterium]MBP9561537.1 cytidylate kinase-like family protein [Syntrophorhabdaceae bacterium]